MWYPQRRICYPTMARAAADHQYDALHEKAPFHNGTFTEWGAKWSKKTPYHYRDGVTLWVAADDLTPHDHFLGGAADCPDCQGGAPSQPDESA